MSAQTNAIRTAASAIVAAADAIDAIPPPPSVGSGPLTWPVGQDCFDCLTAPYNYTFTLTPNDLDSIAIPQPYYDWAIEGARDGMVYIFGDSTTGQIPASMISPFGISFARGGESAARMANKMRQHPGLHNAAAVVIGGIGVNGIMDPYFDGNPNQTAVGFITVVYQYLNVWMRGKWVIRHLLPRVNGTVNAVYNARVAQVNAMIDATIVTTNADFRIVPVHPSLLESDGSLKASMTIDGDRHYNKQAVAIEAATLYAALQDLGVNPA